jgi:hypothetical protein
VVVDPRGDVFERVKGFQDLRAVERVFPEFSCILLGERAIFVQQGFGDPDLAHVMQQGSQLEVANVFLAPVHFAPNLHGVFCHHDRVVGHGWFARLHGADQDPGQVCHLLEALGLAHGYGLRTPAAPQAVPFRERELRVHLRLVHPDKILE